MFERIFSRRFLLFWGCMSWLSLSCSTSLASTPDTSPPNQQEKRSKHTETTDHSYFTRQDVPITFKYILGSLVRNVAISLINMAFIYCIDDYFTLSPITTLLLTLISLTSLQVLVDIGMDFFTPEKQGWLPVFSLSTISHILASAFIFCMSLLSQGAFHSSYNSILVRGIGLFGYICIFACYAMLSHLIWHISTGTLQDPETLLQGAIYSFASALRTTLSFLALLPILSLALFSLEQKAFFVKFQQKALAICFHGLITHFFFNLFLYKFTESNEREEKDIADHIIVQFFGLCISGAITACYLSKILPSSKVYQTRAILLSIGVFFGSALIKNLKELTFDPEKCKNTFVVPIVGTLAAFLLMYGTYIVGTTSPTGTLKTLSKESLINNLICFGGILFGVAILFDGYTHSFHFDTEAFGCLRDVLLLCVGCFLAQNWVGEYLFDGETLFKENKSPAFSLSGLALALMIYALTQKGSMKSLIPFSSMPKHRWEWFNAIVTYLYPLIALFFHPNAHLYSKSVGWTESMITLFIWWYIASLFRKWLDTLPTPTRKNNKRIVHFFYEAIHTFFLFHSAKWFLLEGGTQNGLFWPPNQLATNLLLSDTSLGLLYYFSCRLLPSFVHSASQLYEAYTDKSRS